jgi:N-sulfoglucosamine sulfohydrolase
LKADKLVIPPFLPNDEIVKNDMLDYALEINWFDTQLGKMLQMLREKGELDNTIIIITADNGMAFPYAKTNLQEYGIHVPLAICGAGINGKSRKNDDLISMMDLAPTILDLAHVPHFEGITGKSMFPILKSTQSGIIDKQREFVLVGRERHTHARADNLGYPARAIRTHQYLYIKNLKPNLMPMGDLPPTDPNLALQNPKLAPITEGYEDIDASPTKTFMINNKAKFPELFKMSFEKRDAIQLYDIKKDPFCMNDISKQKNMQSVCAKLDKKLIEKLIEQNDPRMTANGDIFESYPRFGPMRPFAGFKEQGKYNDKYRKK